MNQYIKKELFFITKILIAFIVALSLNEFSSYINMSSENFNLTIISLKVFTFSYLLFSYLSTLEGRLYSIIIPTMLMIGSGTIINSTDSFTFSYNNSLFISTILLNIVYLLYIKNNKKRINS